MKTCHLRISHADYQKLSCHLFPGDGDEHGAVLLAGVSICAGKTTFSVREVHLAAEGSAYVEGTFGHRALSPKFIHNLITRARDERLAYIAVHNHTSDREVGFSSIDIESHERGYPALLQIARGMPVGALVFGKRSMEADMWLADGSRLSLGRADIVGRVIRRLTPAPSLATVEPGEIYDRQIRMFGQLGQAELANCRVGIIGLGGIGSLVSQMLVRLGLGHFCLIDNDVVEASNLSRIVGATTSDARRRVAKTQVAERLIRQCNRRAKVEQVLADVATENAAMKLTGCDYIFLAADSMRSKLVFNALIHQYLIPGVQLGSKIRMKANGDLIDVMSAVRDVRPGQGCLWCNQLVDPAQLAREAKSDRERHAQAYGTEEINPSVIGLNAVASAHAVNAFLLDYLALRGEPRTYTFEHFHFLSGKRDVVVPRRDLDCSECSASGRRYGRGDSVPLPCIGEPS